MQVKFNSLKEKALILVLKACFLENDNIANKNLIKTLFKISSISIH